MSNPAFPRDLSDREKSILRKILQLPFAGKDELLTQIDRGRAVGSWGGNGLSIDIETSSESVTANLADGVAPACGDVYDKSGDYVGEFLIWIKDGRISALEYSWIGGAAPESLPAPDAVTPAHR